MLCVCLSLQVYYVKCFQGTFRPLFIHLNMREVTTDRYGRTIAEAYINGQSVGLQLVSEGYAVVYDRYLDSCPETESEYLAAEEQAQEKRLNYWSQGAIVMPWEFRRKNR